MKSNKEYHLENHIETVADVADRLRNTGYVVNCYRKCDLTGKTVNYRIVLLEFDREYEVNDLDECLKFIVNDAVMLGEMVKIGAIVED